MNAELNIVTQLLMQPWLRTKALVRKDQFENSVLGELLDDLKLERTDEISIMDKLVRAKILTYKEFAAHVDNTKYIDKKGLDVLCKEVRDAAHKRANPHSHTMAEAVEAAYNQVRETAKANGKDIPEFKEVLES